MEAETIQTAAKINYRDLQEPDFGLPNDTIKRRHKETLFAFIRRQTRPQDRPEQELKSLREWIRYYLRKEVINVESSHTARAKIYDLFKFLTYFEKEVRGEDLTHWNKPCSGGFFDILENRNNFASASTQRILATLTNFVTFLIVEEAIKPKDNPIKGTRATIDDDLPPARGPQIVSKTSIDVPEYTQQQIFDIMAKSAQDLLSNNHKWARPKRDLAILFTLRYAAMRVHELCGLQRRLMEDKKNGGVKFYEVHRKGKRKSNIFTPAEAAIYIKQYINDETKKGKDNEIRKAQYEDCPYLFQSHRGGPLSEADVRDIIHKIKTHAEKHYLPEDIIIHVTPHSLRHARGYELRAAGKSDSFIALALGHKDTRQVKRYTRGTDDAVDDELNNVKKTGQ